MSSTLRPIVFSALTVLAGIGAALAGEVEDAGHSQSQAPRADVPALAHSPIRDRNRVFFDTADGETIWIHGRSYKASFGESGARIVPSLGANAPADHSFSIAPVALSRGGAPVSFESASAAHRVGDAIELDRGAFVERYAPSALSIDQSFVFAHAEGAGDLMLRLGVETDLLAFEDAGVLSFDGELGGLTYGQATAIDARGVSAPLATHLAAGGIEIRVPAAYLDSAQYPITIDPVISTFAIDTSANDDFAPDVAYDATNDRYMVCYEEAFSATDHDVYEEVLDANGGFVSAAYVDMTTDNWIHPRIADNRSAAQFMVVAAVGGPGFFGIFSRVASAATNALGVVVAVAPDISQGDPDVGGDPAASGPTGYLVVWSKGGIPGAIRGMWMTNSGLPSTSTSFCIECFSTSDQDSRPAVSNWSGIGNGHDHVWNVAWDQWVNNGKSYIGHAVNYTQVRNDNVLFNPRWLGLLVSVHPVRPSVSSFAEQSASPNTAIVVWDRGLGAGHDIFGSLVEGMTVVATSSLTQLEGSTSASLDQIAPSVDSDGCTFAVTYSEQSSASSSAYDVYVSTFNRVGSSILPFQTHQPVAASPDTESDSRIVFARGGASLRHMIVWSHENSVDGDIYGGLYDTPVLVPYCFAGAPDTAACPCNNPSTANAGCNNSSATGGATLAASGVASLANDSLAFHQSGELASSLSIFLQGTGDVAGGTTFGGGVRCAGGTLMRLFTHNAAGGSVSAPIAGDPSVSARSAALGDTIAPCGTRYYQVYYRDPNLAFCAAGFNIGSGIRALWMP
jgi:hypothetical protein